MRARNGFTIVELLIALVLFLIVSAATFQLLNNTQRVSRAQAERTEMQSNMRAGALIVPAELRSIGYDRFVTGTGPTQGTLALAADSIAFRAVRSSGIICNVAANTYVLDTGGFYTGYRAIAAGRDTLMVFGEMNPSFMSDDIWFRKRITGVGAGNCTAAYGGGRAGTAITTDDAVPGDSIVVGAVFHSFEVMSYKLLQGADNRWYLNARSMSNPGDAYQPMIGPLAPNGFALKYYDVNGNETAVRANVRTIQVTMISQSSSRTSDMGSSNQQIQTDSVVTRVALRNAMR